MAMNDELLRENIRSLIDEKGLKHCRVAEMLGMSKHGFSDMLTGRKTIKAVYIPSLAESIGCTYNDLFRQPESQPT